MYKILGAQIDDGKMLVTVKDSPNFMTYYYYTEEFEHIPDPRLKEYLQKRKIFIMNGNYN